MNCYNCGDPIGDAPIDLNSGKSLEKEKVICEKCLFLFKHEGFEGSKLNTLTFMDSYDSFGNKIVDRLTDEGNVRAKRIQFFDAVESTVANGNKLFFRTVFNGDSEEESFRNLKRFLVNNGYEDIPLPKSARRLWWDYLKPDDDGNFGHFKWYPITISQEEWTINGLILQIHNEEHPDHIKFWEGRLGQDN